MSMETEDRSTSWETAVRQLGPAACCWQEDLAVVLTSRLPSSGQLQNLQVKPPDTGFPQSAASPFAFFYCHARPDTPWLSSQVSLVSQLFVVLKDIMEHLVALRLSMFQKHACIRQWMTVCSLSLTCCGCWCCGHTAWYRYLCELIFTENATAYISIIAEWPILCTESGRRRSIIATRVYNRVILVYIYTVIGLLQSSYFIKSIGTLSSRLQALRRYGHSQGNRFSLQVFSFQDFYIFIKFHLIIYASWYNPR